MKITMSSCGYCNHFKLQKTLWDGRCLLLKIRRNSNTDKCDKFETIEDYKQYESVKVGRNVLRDNNDFDSEIFE